MSELLSAERLARLRNGDFSHHPDTTTRIIRELVDELDAVTRERNETDLRLAAALLDRCKAQKLAGELKRERDDAIAERDRVRARLREAIQLASDWE